MILLQNVPVTEAANLCGLTTNVLSGQLASGNHAGCVAQGSSTITSWVSQS